MKSIIYARFSTDQQSETSIEDQVRICRARAKALGLEIVAVHADRALSGATRVQDRPGGRAMLADAMAGLFSVLVIESLDRLSRDQVEQETIVRRLEHRGVRIIGVSDSYDTESGESRKLLRGVRGMINETYLDDLRKKTHRGLAGQIDARLSCRRIIVRLSVRGRRGERSRRADRASPRDRARQCGDRARDLPALWCGRFLPAHRRGSECAPVKEPARGTWCVSAIYGRRAGAPGS